MPREFVQVAAAEENQAAEDEKQHERQQLVGAAIIDLVVVRVRVRQQQRLVREDGLLVPWVLVGTVRSFFLTLLASGAMTTGLASG